MPDVKVLVCGSVSGQHRRLFQRISNVNVKSGPFDLVLCCGAFEGTDTAEWREYRDGRSAVSLPVYVLGAVGDDQSGGELCANVVALGRRGVFSTAGGLRVAYMAPPEGEPVSPTDVTSLEATVTASGAAGVDIFVTSWWPRGVTRLASNPEGVYSEETGSALVARLLFSLRPRYVFTGGMDLHYERLPYRNHVVLQQTQCHVTRFISLAKTLNAQKSKWLYAFAVSPMDSMSRADLVVQPPDTTGCPFEAAEMAAVMASCEAPTQYFYATDRRGSGKQHPKKKQRTEDDRPRQEAKPKQPCWFCLASPKVEKHLVVNVGDLCYMALAKGGLVADHVLILPVEHVRSLSEASEELLAEISDCQRRLSALFQLQEKRVVFYERNYRQSHLQVQCVPLPSSVMRSDHLTESITSHCAAHDVQLNELPRLAELRQAVRDRTPYFYVVLPDGRRMFHQISGEFPLNLGRAMLACPPLLNMPDRVEWSACVLDTEKETQLAREFKANLKRIS